MTCGAGVPVDLSDPLQWIMLACLLGIGGAPMATVIYLLFRDKDSPV